MIQHPIYPSGAGRAPYLLVGEAPNAAMSRLGLERCTLLPDDSGIAHSANRLLAFTGWDGSDFRRLFDRANVLPYCPPPAGRGRGFPLAEARRAACDLYLEAIGRYVAIVVLGKRAARAFAWRELPATPRHVPGRIPYSRLSYLRRAALEPHPSARTGGGVFSGAPGAIVPHPSGLNRWWNEERNRESARAFFRALLEEAEARGFAR